MASMLLSSSNRRRSRSPRTAFPTFFEMTSPARARSFSSTSQSAATSTFDSPAKPSASSVPRPFTPMTAIETFELGAPRTIAGNATAAAVVRRKWRRFMVPETIVECGWSLRLTPRPSFPRLRVVEADRLQRGGHDPRFLARVGRREGVGSPCTTARRTAPVVRRSAWRLAMSGVCDTIFRTQADCCRDVQAKDGRAFRRDFSVTLFVRDGIIHQSFDF